MPYQTLFVTGASGLLGSNVCLLAAAQGRRVKGLVRKADDAEVLARAGIEPVLGDILRPGGFVAALGDVDAIVHAAALIGGTWATAAPEEFESVNHVGTLGVLDAAREAGVGRFVQIATMAIFASLDTVTEDTPLIQPGKGSPYMRSKLAAYRAAMERAREGLAVSAVFPAAIYGPSPFVARALDPTLFTGALQRAIAGQLTEYVRFPMTWPFIEDAAGVVLAALDKGRSGANYLAAGDPRDTRSLAEFCNIGCELAGVPHRVRDLSLEDCGEEIGAIRAMAERRYADPLIDPSETTRALGCGYRPVEQGVEETVRWLRDNRCI